jgi:DNA invertase Pin-like site-specific DNA recombinase
MIIGYARVSTEEQNLDRQLEQLKAYGCEKIHQEKTSGATTKRKELQTMLNSLQENDVVVVSDLTRISRTLSDLLKLVETITQKGASLKSIKDTWLDTTEDNPYSKFLLVVMGGVSQLERDLIKQRQAEGISLAKRSGKYKGRIRKYTDKHMGMQHAIGLYTARESNQMTVKEICEITGVSRSALYREIEKQVESRSVRN